MSYCMNKHEIVHAQVSLSESELCSMDKSDLEACVKRSLASLLVEHIMGNLKVVEIKKDIDLNVLKRTFEASFVCISPSDYRNIIDVVRRHDHHVMDTNGNIVRFSDIL